MSTTAPPTAAAPTDAAAGRSARPAPGRPATVWHDLTPRLLTVAATTRPTPRTVRVTLTGDQLDGFAHTAPDDHVKLFFPRPGQTLPVMPTLGPDGLVPPPPGAPDPVFRDYTVRALRPAARELDVDFVLHGHGPAATWAAQAAPGQHLGVLGPRGSLLVPDGFDWYLLGADATALPALAVWLERLPAGTAVHAVAEVHDPAEQQPLTSAADLTLTWVHTTTHTGPGTALEQAVRAFTPPPGHGYVWIAGEAGALVPVRRHVRTWGLPRHHVAVDGYWRRGTTNHDHHDEPDEH